MNELQIFRNESFGEIRTLEINGEPWFVAADVCKALELESVSKVIARLDDDECTRIEIPHPQNPEKFMMVNAVNEPGLYALVLGSRKPEAKAFKRWITHDVIPTIRKTGSYNLPKDYPSALRALADAEEKRLALEVENETMRPKALFADSVATAKTTILVGELAKILKQNGVNIGQNRLFEWLRNNGYLIRRKGSDFNMPTQRAMEMGLFEIKESVITHADGHTTISKTPKITGNGQMRLVNLFLSDLQGEQIAL